MADRVLRDLRERVAKLERHQLRLRQGVMDDVDSVLIGGASEPKAPVQVIGGASAGDRVSVLSAGKDAAVLSPTNDFSGSDIILPPGFVDEDSLSAAVAADIDLAFSRWSPVPLSQMGGAGFGSGTSGGSLVLLTPGSVTTAGTDASASSIIPFDRASYGAGDRDVFVRIICTAVTNNTAPGRDVQFTLRELSSIDATAGGPRATPGSIVASGDAERTIASAALTLRTWVGLSVYSDPFAAPAAGGYILCVSPLVGAVTAGASVLVRASLEVCQV